MSRKELGLCTKSLRYPIFDSVVMATADGGTMQSFQKHIEDMRNLTLCKICLKPFFEPYIISCGHTYCYGCLRSWFGNNTDRTKTKSCPDCRIVVEVQPAPNYILRDLTHMFIDRAELLPEDESVQEHNKDKEEAASQLTRDRDGPGLFQGIFNHRLPTHLLRGPIHDIEDGVDRCPVCNWELEHGVCAGCGLNMNDSDYDTDDTEDSMAFDIPRPEGMFYGVGSDSEDDSSEDESNLSGPNEYDHHDDFLDNENEDDADDMDETEGLAQSDDYYDEDARDAAFLRASRRVVMSDEDSSDEEEEDDDEDDEDEMQPRERRPRPRPTFAAVELSEDEATNYDESDNEMEHDMTNQRMEQAESEDEEPVARFRSTSNSRAKAVSTHRRRPLVVVDDDDEDEASIQSGSASFSSRAKTESSASEDSSDEDEDPAGERPESVSDGSFESESQLEAGNSQELQEDSESEDSDETIRTPQPRHIRRQKLQNQRARRPQPHQSRILPSMSNYPHNAPDEIAPRGQSKAERVY